MGTHPNAPSKVEYPSGVKPLRDILDEGECCQLRVTTYASHLVIDLPFLLKVLSVAKALSIQAHPDKELAKELHARDPKNYRDPNHKPEMTIALSEFEALSGFRPLDTIVAHLQAVPELAALVSEETRQRLVAASKSDDSKEQKAGLKQFFSEFIVAPKDLVCEQIKRFEERITTMNRTTSELEELCLRLNGQFPEEVGCFCVFLLNYLKLAPGEAIFLAANEPHAYLSGDCIECMALSDNVVRAGLTPKFRDVETLVGMLTYKTYLPEELAMKPSKLTDRPASLLYKPPVREFQVIKTTLQLGESEMIKSESSHSLLLCIRGDLCIKASGLESKITAGSVLLLEKDSRLEATCNSSEALLFQACASN